MGLTRLRAMLESAHEIDPRDESEAAKQVREFESVAIFDGLEFWAEVEIKPGDNGYRDRNSIFRLAGPGDGDWRTAAPAQKTESAEETLAKPKGRDMDDEIPF